MKTYFECYRERLKINDSKFRELAADLKNMGCNVYAPKDKLINFIVIETDNKQITLEFREVPYRWALYSSHKPNQKTGSGITIENLYNTECTYTAIDIFNKMQPLTYAKNKTYLAKL